MSDAISDEYDFVCLYRPVAIGPMGEFIILIVKASNGVKNILLFNTDGTLHRRPDSLPEGEAKRLQAEFLGVHLSHCCTKHGCKYGEHDQCPVALGLLKPDVPTCETCWEERVQEEDNQRLIDSFEVRAEPRNVEYKLKGEVCVSFGDEMVFVTPHVARDWSQKLLEGAAQAERTDVEEKEDDARRVPRNDP